FLSTPLLPISTLFPYTTLFRSGALLTAGLLVVGRIKNIDRPGLMPIIPTVSKESPQVILMDAGANAEVKPVNLEQFTVLANFYADRKSTRLNSSHVSISYAVFC